MSDSKNKGIRYDREHIKFAQLLKKAETEGRLDGKFHCNICGMKFAEKKEAEKCCNAESSS